MNHVKSLKCMVSTKSACANMATQILGSTAPKSWITLIYVLSLMAKSFVCTVVCRQIFVSGGSFCLALGICPSLLGVATCARVERPFSSFFPLVLLCFGRFGTRVFKFLFLIRGYRESVERSPLTWDVFFSVSFCFFLSFDMWRSHPPHSTSLVRTATTKHRHHRSGKCFDH